MIFTFTTTLSVANAEIGGDMFYDYVCRVCNTGCYYENPEHDRKQCKAFVKNKKKWGIPPKVRTDQDDLLRSVKTGKGRMFTAEDQKKIDEQVMGW
jgi:hypothetical protein